ncbi:regulatory protein YycI of two-component signal transduction system YycFG [Salirhabdus euzebyi]|uniref:Regulatory protein YycI of two-component signal transduction system YycFG n=1 Tax=Salirhabdus euzebyi TaxID=394506 RepID=A0A841Q7P1_9BACI|nr:two-component system regulatory protein YycI [Salirhabdus euzebyi]MBB6454451.1 regulatory protein YycI of two-component signal transduction system YycFG [Salirhabdus euzebyi]
MQWGQIKTIFIICFLILDIYLITQVLAKESEPGELFNPETTSIREELEEKNINIENIPESSKKATYISASWHSFTEEELQTIKNQTVMNAGDMIIADFNEPIVLSEDITVEEVTRKVTENILYSDKYVFWGWDEEKNIMLFFQQHNGQPIYYNKGGMLYIQLNEENEMVSYGQTMLEEITLQSEETDVSKPIEAVEVLLENNKIFSGDHISSMELGYHTFFPFDNGVQVFVPTWKVIVNNNQTHFINAMEGQIISKDEDEFITEIQQSIEKVRSTIGSEES